MRRTTARRYVAGGLFAALLCCAYVATAQITSNPATPGFSTGAAPATGSFANSPSGMAATPPAPINGIPTEAGLPTLNSTPANARASADAANARASAATAADQQRGGGSPTTGNVTEY